MKTTEQDFLKFMFPIIIFAALVCVVEGVIKSNNCTIVEKEIMTREHHCMGHNCKYTYYFRGANSIDSEKYYEVGDYYGVEICK